MLSNTATSRNVTLPLDISHFQENVKDEMVENKIPGTSCNQIAVANLVAARTSLSVGFNFFFYLSLKTQIH